MDFSPLWISAKITLVAGAIVFVLGILCARLSLGAGRRLRWLLDVIFTLPLVLPPTVVGFVLLVLFGKNSALGRFLASIQLSLIFTWQGAVLAAVVVSFPLMYRAAKGALEQVDKSLLWAARTLGMPEWRVFLRVMAPQAWPGIASGAVLAFARALGEFGATLMLAGNIPGRTQTIPLAIYFATASGNLRAAAIWTVIITVFSCLMLALLNRTPRRARSKSSAVKTGE